VIVTDHTFPITNSLASNSMEMWDLGCAGSST